MTEATCIVHVVDDDEAWRKSMQRLVSAAGYRVAMYDSSQAFLDTANLDAPGCVLLDLTMPGMTGLELQEGLRAGGRELPIVFISGDGDIRSSVLAMKAGAEDFLTKPIDTDQLLTAVERAVTRDRENRDRRHGLEAMRARVDGLTATERKVFALVVRGRMNKQIAIELGSAERTIKWHRQHIMQKLQTESLAELVVIAERLGLVDGVDRPMNPVN